MKSGDFIPKRGDVVWLNFTPQAGHEQRGKRPALVISAKIYNEKTSLCLCLPITSKVKNYPFEVALPKDFAIEGVILSDQLKSLDFQARAASYIDTLPADIVSQVVENINALIEE